MTVTVMCLQHQDQESLKVYSYRLAWTEQYFSHMLHVGKESQHLREFHPEKINFNKVYNRLIKCTSQGLRKNADNRIGFKNGNRFLVKAYFTFGQRTVREGTVHLVQTLNVPLVFYLMTNKNVRTGLCTDPRLKIKDALFPSNYMYLYDRRVLSPNGCYRIPPGTTYILLSIQKNFFSVDVFPKGAEIPLDVTDPVAKRVIKIVRRDNIYDRPVATPYIEDVVEEEKSKALEDLFATIRPSIKRPPSSSSSSCGSFKRPFVPRQPIPAAESFMQEEPSSFVPRQSPDPDPEQQCFMQEEPSSFVPRQPIPEQSFMQEEPSSFVQQSPIPEQCFMQEEPSSFVQQSPIPEQQCFIQDEPSSFVQQSPIPEQQSFMQEEPSSFVQQPPIPEQCFMLDEPSFFVQQPPIPEQSFMQEEPSSFVQQPPPEQQQTFIESLLQQEESFVQQPPPEQQQQQTFIEPLLLKQEESFIPESDLQPSQIYSRPIVVAHPDCIRYFQEFLKKTVHLSPTKDFVIQQSTNDGDYKPLDLSLKDMFDFDCKEKIRNYEDILLDLRSIID